MHDAKSSDSIQIQICQNQNCCKTPTLPGTYAKESTEMFSGSKLGECENKTINLNEPINVILNSISTNAWKGKLATITTAPSTPPVGNMTSTQKFSYKCIITTWLDVNETESFETTCYNTGNSNYQLFLCCTKKHGDNYTVINFKILW